ncbi:MAG: iron ABC transporter [Arcanobacterium sp.]|nr:iron ABC transporter [Arcanobacterium sp.]
MRWTTRNTWLRIAALLIVFLAVPAILGEFTRTLPAWNCGLASAITELFIIFPITTIFLAAWDGAKEGFSLLWIICPILCFVVPMLLFFNESALIYGAAYSVLGIAANGIASLFHRNPGTPQNPTV